MIACVDDDGIPCEDISVEPVVCEQRATEITMVFNGGNCDRSFNVQSVDLFQCIDFNGGPPLEGTVFIRAVDTKGRGINYFSGAVDVGGSFRLFDGGERLQADMSILISEGNMSGGAPLQLINWHSSCSRNLFLKDFYGSNQVVEWVNEEQGTVNCLRNLTYNYLIENNGDVNAELLSLTTTVNGRTEDLTPQVANQVVGTMGTFTTQFRVEVDLTTRQQYTVDATLTGQPIPANGQTCSDSDRLQFVAGTPPPPNFPTPAFTQAPTATMVPTPDPEVTSCTIDASVRCVLGNDAPCSILQALPASDLTCDLNNPIQFGFFYRGTSCSATTTNQVIACMDMGGGPMGVDEVFIDVSNFDQSETYFSDTVSVGDLVVMRQDNLDPLDDNVLVTISRVGVMGEILQMFSLSIECEPADDLTIGRRFGALELASYRSDDDLVEGFQAVFWDFEVQNDGSLPFTLTQLDTVVDGVPTDLLPPAPAIRLARRQEFATRSPFIVPLITTGTFTGSLQTSGVTSAGLSCTAEDAFSFSVAAP